MLLLENNQIPSIKYQPVYCVPWMDGKYPQNIHFCLKLLTVIQKNTNGCKGKRKETYSSLQAGLRSPLRELTYHMGSHSVTCHPAEVTFLPLPQPKLVLELATPEGCKAEWT